MSVIVMCVLEIGQDHFFWSSFQFCFIIYLIRAVVKVSYINDFLKVAQLISTGGIKHKLKTSSRLCEIL